METIKHKIPSSKQEKPKRIYSEKVNLTNKGLVDRYGRPIIPPPPRTYNNK